MNTARTFFDLRRNPIGDEMVTALLGTLQTAVSAVVRCSRADTDIRAPQDPIGDLGWGGSCPRGWYDVTGQGVCNDYCRWVGNCGCRGECSWWSCAMAGTSNAHTTSETVRETDYPECSAKGAIPPRTNYVFVHDGRCVASWTSESNTIQTHGIVTNQANIEACGRQCCGHALESGAFRQCT